MYRMRAAAILVLALSAVGSVLAPLAGLALAGQSIAPYVAFPPRTEFVPHAAFQWGAFVVLCVPAIAALALYATALARAVPVPAEERPCAFPWWGWLGLALIGAGWVLAWSGFAADWRRHTFTPLWVGYILVMNGLAMRAGGRSLLTHRTAWFLALFPVSAVFWWIFEYLNQFVDNWYYRGLDAAGHWDYFLQATLPFSSVLPAVASTWAWLRTLPRIEAMSLPAMRGHRWLAWAALIAGAVALLGIGVWPDALFAMLWLAPLLVAVGLQHLLMRETLLSPLASGDWRPVLQPALAALVCGFFWEMWNYGSLAKWHYSISYAERFPVFEMPLLGYAGYLPFGVHCAVLMDLVARMLERRSVWPLLALSHR
jgi:hypothetical protein